LLRSDQSAWYVAVARMSAQATATERVQQDILRNLCLRTPLVLKTTCAPGSARIRV
jgi:superfamily II DNA helicase RecQ